MPKKSFHMQYVKSTRRTAVYQNGGDRGSTAVQVVYVEKAHLPSKIPDEIKLTVEFKEA